MASKKAADWVDPKGRDIEDCTNPFRAQNNLRIRDIVIRDGETDNSGRKGLPILDVATRFKKEHRQPLGGIPNLSEDRLYTKMKSVDTVDWVVEKVGDVVYVIVPLVTLRKALAGPTNAPAPSIHPLLSPMVHRSLISWDSLGRQNMTSSSIANPSAISTYDKNADAINQNQTSPRTTNHNTFSGFTTTANSFNQDKTSSSLADPNSIPIYDTKADAINQNPWTAHRKPFSGFRTAANVINQNQTSSSMANPSAVPTDNTQVHSSSQDQTSLSTANHRAISTDNTTADSSNQHGSSSHVFRPSNANSILHSQTYDETYDWQKLIVLWQADDRESKQQPATPAQQESAPSFGTQSSATHQHPTSPPSAVAAGRYQQLPVDAAPAFGTRSMFAGDLSTVAFGTQSGSRDRTRDQSNKKFY